MRKMWDGVSWSDSWWELILEHKLARVSESWWSWWKLVRVNERWSQLIRVDENWWGLIRVDKSWWELMWKLMRVEESWWDLIGVGYHNTLFNFIHTTGNFGFGFPYSVVKPCEHIQTSDRNLQEKETLKKWGHSACEWELLANTCWP